MESKCRALRGLLAVAAVLLLAGCRRATPEPSPPAATPIPTAQLTATPVPGLSPDQVATLRSLEKVDGYPLYVMHYQEGYAAGEGARRVARPLPAGGEPAWGCSLFAALADGTQRLYGRNFDWEYSPALLLFTDPPGGYASVSMVDIAYLVEPDAAARLDELPLAERQPLLYAPQIPFDGMNEEGLAVGMASVPSSDMPRDPARATIGSLEVIRQMLDHARTVDEAVAILGSYNIEMSAGVPLHYLIADRSGQAALVEFAQGNMVALPNQGPWHLATNFLRAEADQTGRHACARYDRIQARMEETGGRLTPVEAMELLDQVSQPNLTQWSVVYSLGSGEVRVVMRGEYNRAHSFRLGLD